MKKLEICRLCKKDRDLTKSHIIPKCLYDDLLSNQRKHKIPFQIDIDKKKSRKPGGYYEELLCKDCENFLSKYDKCICEFLNKFKNNCIKCKIHTNSLKEKYYICEHIENRECLYKAITSIIWRMHHSKQYFFSDVCLGKYEQTIRDYIYTNKGSNDIKRILDVFIIKISSSVEDATKIMTNPCKVREKDRNCYRITIPHYSILVKVDSQPWPNTLIPHFMDGENFFFGMPNDSVIIAEKDIKHVKYIADLFRKIHWPPI